MRFGAPVYDFDSPETWVARHRESGYRAAYAVTGPDAEAYAAAARQAGLVLAEVGIWNNPVSGSEAVELCKERLALADRLGARCAVNIAGSCGEQWDGPDAANFSAETFERVVLTVREIIDHVQPRVAKYALETMPWMLPWDADSALALVRAVDREAFAIHYDPINLVTSPRDFYRTGEMVREFVDKVGPWIVAVHLKDIALSGRLTVHLDEVRLGLGGFDHRALVRELKRLPDDTPALLEHLATAEDYSAAADAFREAACAEGVEL